MLAFLGGEYRYLQPGSALGVHQFSIGEDVSAPSFDAPTALTVSQMLAGEIVDFLDRMNVDPSLFKLMTQTIPKNIYIIPTDELTKLKVITGDILSETWTFELEAGAHYLKADQVTWRGENKLIFTCLPGEGPALLALSQLPDPQSILQSSREIVIFIDGRDILIPFDEVTTAPKQSGPYLSWGVLISPELSAAMREAQTIGSGLVPPSHQIFSGFDSLHVGTARSKLISFLDSCGGNTPTVAQNPQPDASPENEAWSLLGEWIQLFSRRSEAEAKDLAQIYSLRLKNVRVFRYDNGWFVGVVGPLDHPTAVAVLQRQVALGTIPSDSLINSGHRFVQLIWSSSP